MTDNATNRSNGDGDESTNQAADEAGRVGGQSERGSSDQSAVVRDDANDGGPSQPTSGQNQPSAGSNQPSTGSNQPSTGSSQPSTGSNQPSTGAGQPSTDSSQPSAGSGQPTTGSGQPSTGSGQPSTGSGQPSSGQGQPSASTGQTGQTATTAGTGTSSAAGSGGTGLEPNVAGALAYLFAPLAGIVMYVLEGEDDFVRFHSIQAIAFGVLMFAAWFGVFVVQVVGTMILDGVPILGALWGLFTFLLYPLVGFVGFAAWAFLTYKAYSGDRFKIPVIGSFAASK